MEFNLQTFVRLRRQHHMLEENYCKFGLRDTLNRVNTDSQIWHSQKRGGKNARFFFNNRKQILF